MYVFLTWNPLFKYDISFSDFNGLSHKQQQSNNLNAFSLEDLRLEADFIYIYFQEYAPLVRCDAWRCWIIVSENNVRNGKVLLRPRLATNNTA